jgi:ABC-2 type transport system ATP-binding protein
LLGPASLLGGCLKKEVIIYLEHLTKTYGDILAVNDLSLEIYEGEIFGLLGPNGAGKTTTINLIAGIIKPDMGQVFFNGSPVQDHDENYLKKVGICPQENVHWKKLTPEEQLIFLGQMYGMGPAKIRERSQILIEALGLTDVARRLTGKLSGGMKRRLNIALALIHDPQILILDEPEAGLDPQSRIDVRDYIKSLAKNKTVILTTHNMDEAHRMADRVAVIDMGRLLVIDTPDALVGKVGEGDVLEIEFAGFGSGQEDFVLDLPDQSQKLILEDILQIRGLDLVNHLPGILSSLEKSGVQIGEIRLRKNTLEDVFIQLTGRRLRE